MRFFFRVPAVLLAVTACTSGHPWKYSHVNGESDQFRSSRLSYAILNTPNPLQLEIIRKKETNKAYLSTQGKAFSEHPDHPGYTLISISAKDSTKSYLAKRYEGGQRLVLPEILIEKILDGLQSGEEIIVKTTGYMTTLKPEGFAPAYEKWQKNRKIPELIKAPF